MNDFAGTLQLSTAGFQQFKEPNKWHKLLEKKLGKMSNVRIYKNTMINKLQVKNKKYIQLLVVIIKNLKLIKFFCAHNQQDF